MSQWSAHQSPRTSRAPQQARDVARKGEPRQPAAAKPPAAAKTSGYTIAHAGRQIRFGPVAFWIAVGTVVILAGWSATTATYFAFSDDVLKGLIARQAEQQYAYEDRIAELRAQIDRTTSRQLLDQEQFEQKLNDLLRRQAALESRATALSGISDPVTTGSLRSSTGSNDPKSISDSLLTPHPLDRGTALEPDRAPTNKKPGKEADIGTKLGRIEASLDRVDRREAAVLAQLQTRYEAKARKMRGVLAQLGLKLDANPPPGIGGPFVPVPLPSESQSFERALTRVNIARAYADKLSATLVSVPVREPVTGEIDFSSPFGVRVDPFLHVPAMHTGIDFRGTYGEPAHATAAGTVTSAGWSGGYGQMVEIDHGNGLATRYGHLSEIDVRVGQSIRIGQVVGRIGSTGRSTGPHLHYETRVDGEAVDPQRFLKAGATLFGG
ncbi:MAG: M23 family metallopeptidase [Xanthobacteraceae bacterium]|jgi:murein DD-endopeptidase MepM/ murein hydrolase activator NlpD